MMREARALRGARAGHTARHRVKFADPHAREGMRRHRPAARTADRRVVRPDVRVERFERQITARAAVTEDREQGEALAVERRRDRGARGELGEVHQPRRPVVS